MPLRALCVSACMIMPGISWSLGGNDGGIGSSLWDIVKGLWQEWRGPSAPTTPLPKDLQWQIQPTPTSPEGSRLQIVISQRLEDDELHSLVHQIAQQHARLPSLRHGIDVWLTPWTHDTWASAAPTPRVAWDLRLNGHTPGGLRMLQTMVAQLPGEHLGAWSGWQSDSPALALYRHQGQTYLRELQTHAPMTIPVTLQRAGPITLVQLEAPLNDSAYRILPSGWLQPYFKDQSFGALMPLADLLHERPSRP